MAEARASEVPASLGGIRGFAFDLDGTIWAGPTLLPGAAELVASLRGAGLGVVFASNSSRHGSALLARRLTAMGIEADAGDVVAALDLVGEEIRRHLGHVRVLPLGTSDLADLLRSAGHAVVPIEEWAEAQAVVVGNDPSFDFGRLAHCLPCRRRGCGILRGEHGRPLPGGGGPVRSRVRRWPRRSPWRRGKDQYRSANPTGPCSRSRLHAWATGAAEAAMVGDNVPSDIAGGRAAGMLTIWLDDRNDVSMPPEADLKVGSLNELHQLWLADRDPRSVFSRHSERSC